jgi:hypothetical protein
VSSGNRSTGCSRAHGLRHRSAIARGSALPTADLAIRKLAAIEALARHDRAKPQMLDAIAIDPARWPTSALIDWIGILQRVKGVKDREARREEALSILRSRLELPGHRDDVLHRAQRRALVAHGLGGRERQPRVAGDPCRAGMEGRLGRMVRGALSRQLRGAWARRSRMPGARSRLDRYIDAFEKVPARYS